MATLIDTTSPYISSYAANGLHSVDKLASGHAINKASDDPSGLTVANGLQVHSRVLAQSIANSTSGIALANIAQSALHNQKDILSEIRQLTVQASSDTFNNDDRQVIANQIDKLLQGFESITESTNYNGEKLLQTTGESSDDLSIIGEEKIVSIYKADTASISDSLRTFLGEFPINPDARENMLNVLDQNINELANFANEFGSASQALESMVRNQLTNVTNNEKAKSIIANTDFGQEVSDFSKTNLLNQVGYLMQTQANAHTQRTIAILK